jgi:hypothetical protein
MLNQYKGRPYHTPPKAPSTASILDSTNGTILRIPCACPKTRADLWFDEETFNIHVKLSDKGLLSCNSINGNGTLKVQLTGFLQDNSLDYEDMAGIYWVRWIKRPTHFVVLHATKKRRSSTKKRNNQKVCIVISEEEKEVWDRARGSLPMSTFVRSSVSRHLEDGGWTFSD